VRSGLVAIQTPQVFRFDLLLAAHVRARETALEATDDASLVHPFSPVTVVEGARDNIKITYPEHVCFAEAQLAASCDGFMATTGKGG
jgi:2-C-methyl-D-erythritol 4-phosphate cytidylyltransferase